MRRSVTLQLIVAILLMLPFPLVSQVLPECSNGVDDDGDGLVDYPADPSCLAPDGARERGGQPDFGVGDLSTSDGFDLALPRDLAGTDIVAEGNGPASGEQVFVAPGFQSGPQARGCAMVPRGQGVNAVVAGALLLLLFRGRRRGT